MTENGVGRIDFLRSEEAKLRDNFPGKDLESRVGENLLRAWVIVKRELAMLETGKVPTSLLRTNLLWWSSKSKVTSRLTPEVHHLGRGSYLRDILRMARSGSKEGEMSS